MYVEWSGQLFIDGRWCDGRSPERGIVISPSTEEPIGDFPLAAEGDVDAAVSAADVALRSGPWPKMSVAERVQVLRGALDGLRQRGDRLSALITDEVGTPTTAMQARMQRIYAMFDAVLDTAGAFPLTETRRHAGGVLEIERVPVGVVASIAPWNGPLDVTINKVVAPLLMGNPVVFKPAVEVSLDACGFVEAFESAGLPPGVLNLVLGGAEVGERLVRHPAVGKVTFTGSTAAGRRIGAICGERLTRPSLELGGKSAAIILADADLGAVLPYVREGSFGNSGQRCIALSRILAPAHRLEEVEEMVVEAARGLVLGDPHDPATQMGPLATKAHRERVERAVAQARDDGGVVATGGRRPADQDRGWYYEPTVFTGLDNGARLAQEEVFGPVTMVLPYADEEEAVRIANDTAYGLHGAVFGTAFDRAREIAARVEAGTMAVNGFGVAGVFGGIKASGVGREGGPEGLAEFLEYRATSLPALR